MVGFQKKTMIKMLHIYNLFGKENIHPPPIKKKNRRKGVLRLDRFAKQFDSMIDLMDRLAK